MCTFVDYSASAFSLFVTPWVGSNPGPLNEKPGILHSEPLLLGFVIIAFSEKEGLSKYFGMIGFE